MKILATILTLAIAGGVAVTPVLAGEHEDESGERGEYQEHGNRGLESLPPAIQAAIEAASPGAEVMGARMENEDGVKCFEVRATSPSGARMEFKVSPIGDVIEIEEECEAADAPAAIRTHLKNLFPGSDMEELERKTCTVYAAEKEFGPTVYEVQIDASGRLLSIEAENEGADEEDEDSAEAVDVTQLPEAVRSAVPSAQVKRAMLESEDGTLVYEVLVTNSDGATLEVVVTTDGALIETEQRTTLEALPATVRHTLESVLPGSDLDELERKQIVLYEAEFEGEELSCEVQMDATGRILKTESEHEDHEQGEQYKRGDDEDERGGRYEREHDEDDRGGRFEREHDDDDD
ncbi:PepSY-like domain-containing protein [bacterium]|nr:PepSY-like domain-containing protein [bacterium]